MGVVARQVLAGLLVAILSAGVAFGQGTAIIAPVPAGIANVSGLVQFTGYDNSLQFQAGLQFGAVEYWTGMGGIAGTGGTLYASNGNLTGNVNGNFVAQNQGGFIFGNGSGTLFAVADSGGSPGAPPSFISIRPGSTTTSPTVYPAIYSTGDLSLVPAGSGNRITAADPDGTAVGGGARAAGCRDWQGPSDRSTQFQVCNGDHGVILGGQSNTITTAGATGLAFGFGNVVDGGYCWAVGNQSACDGRRGVEARTGNTFAQPGDTQITRGALSGSSVAGAAIRLTANAGVASAVNCWNLPLGKAFGGKLTLVGQDSTTIAHQVLWTSRVIIAHNNGGTMTVTNGAADAQIGSDTVTVSSTADSTNSCLNFTVTPASSTADTWWYTLEIEGAESRH